MKLPIPKPARIDVAMYRRFATKELQAPDDVKRQLRRAVDAYARITKRGKADPKNLKIVVDAATHRLAALWCSATDLLAALAADFPEAKQAVRDIMQHGKAAQRWHMIEGLPYCADVRFAQEIVAKAINDRAASVRLRAFEMAVWRRFVRLVPCLEERLLIEVDCDLRECLQQSIALLKDGYYLHQSPGDLTDLELCVQTHTGIGWSSVTQSDVDADRIPAIADQIQREAVRIHGSHT